jgi:hypothetical protein
MLDYPALEIDFREVVRSGAGNGRYVGIGLEEDGAGKTCEPARKRNANRWRARQRDQLCRISVVLENPSIIPSWLEPYGIGARQTGR